MPDGGKGRTKAGEERNASMWTFDDGAGDLDLGAFRINLVYGWHQLIEGIKRLGG